MADDAAVRVHRIQGTSGTASAGKPELDIVFLHGLMGHWRNTWSAGKDQNWLDVLARAMPKARIWSVEYPATALHWRAFVAQQQPGTPALADRILQCLGDQQIAKPEGPPCVWVCHSLGGILAKRMLLRAADLQRLPSPAIDHQKVEGLMFLGTPHRGSDLANWSKGLVSFKTIALGGLGAVGELFGAMSGLGAAGAAAIDRGFLDSSQLLEELVIHNTELANLNSRFNTYLVERWSAPGADRRLALRICAETLPLTGTGKLVVERESADPGFHLQANGPNVPVLQLHACHGSICKPIDENAEVYSYLEGLAREVLGQDAFADPTADSPSHYRVRAAVFRHLSRCPSLVQPLIRAANINATTDEARRIELMGRLIGDGQFADLLSGLNLLTLSLEQARGQYSPSREWADDISTLLGWLLTAIAAQAQVTRSRLTDTARHADESKVLDGALLVGALAAHHGWPAKMQLGMAAESTFGSAHVATVDDLAAMDFRPQHLVDELERQLHRDVQGPESVPLRHVLQGQTSLGPLNDYERGRLSNKLARLLQSHIGIAIDDRRNGALVVNGELTSALEQSRLSENICILGPASTEWNLSDDEKGRFADALEAYDRARQALDLPRS